MAQITWKMTLAALVMAQMFQSQPVLAQTVPLTLTTTPAITVEMAIPAPVAPTMQDALLKVCETNGYSEACAKTLLGMLWIESSNISTAIGDGGRARGYFQIHYKLHNITTNCAEDVVCAANWTINYLERNSYPTYVTYAVQCHNSCNAGNGYAARAARAGERLWAEPMTITQATPVVLASI